jgi:predicted ribonuclease toxin of YeeF-YezG toxin-antitoxin module
LAQSMRKTRVGRRKALTKQPGIRGPMKNERQLSTPPKRREKGKYQTVILEQAPPGAQEVSMNSQRSIDSELLEEESSETLDDESSFDEPGGETTR